MSGPPRRKPPLPRPRPKAQRFDPSQPLLDFDEPATAKFEQGGAPPEPILSSLKLPSKKSPKQSAGLGPVSMTDPIQDAQTLVSPVDPARNFDDLGGGTQVAPLPTGGTQVGPPPIPTAAPIPAAIIPGARNAPRSPLPFMILGVTAAMTWGAAVAAGVLYEPHELPDMGVAEASVSAPMTGASAVSSAPKTGAEPAGSDSSPLPSTGNTAKGPRNQEASAAVPTASWSVTADAPPRALVLAGSTAVGSYQESIVGYADGASVWTFEGSHEGAWPTSDGSVAVVLSKELVILSGEDGSERYRAEVPAIADKDPEVVAADADLGHVLVALADARFVLFTLSACGDAPAEGEECVRVIGRLSGEYLEPSAKVALGEDGTRYLAEDDALRAFDLDLRTVFEASAPSNLRSLVAVPGGRVALQFGQEAVLLDRERCRGRAEVTIRTSDVQAPSGCVLWRFGRAIDPVPPAAIDTSSLALNERGKLQVVAEGDELWKLPLATFGPVARGDGVVFSLATEGEGLVVAEVDASNGTVNAKHPLPITASAEDHANAHLVWNAGTLAASIGPHIAVLTL